VGYSFTCAHVPGKPVPYMTRDITGTIVNVGCGLVPG